MKHTWKEIDEHEQSVHMFPIDERSKQCVNNFFLFLVEMPQFPYDFLILKTELNEKIFEYHSRNDLLNVFSPLNTILERYPGVIGTLGNTQKYRPSYLKFEKIIDDKLLKKYLNQIKQLEDSKKLNTNEKTKIFYEIGKKFRLSNFLSEDVNGHRLTLSSKMNSFTLLGSMDVIGNDSTLCNYEIVFMSKNRQYFWARNTAFNNKIDYDFSTYLHFISVLLYLNNQLREIDQHEVSFTSLVNEYRKLREKNTDEKKVFYDKMNTFDEKLFFLKSDLKQIDFALNSFLAETIRGIHNYNIMSPKQYERNTLFSQGMFDLSYEGSKNNLKQLLKKLSELQKEILGLKEKFEKDIIFENNLTMKEHTKQNNWLTFSMVILSIVITVSTIYGVISNIGD